MPNSPEHILFVCVGNVCRSPMAEGSWNLCRRQPPAESAGIGAHAGQPADRHAIELLRGKGWDLESHRARKLTASMATGASMILVMEEKHKAAVLRLAPSSRGKVFRLGHFGKFDIPDPYGRERDAFEASLALIERGIDDFVRAFWTKK